MDENQLSEFKTIIAGLDSRLTRLESKLSPKNQPELPSTPTPPMPKDGSLAQASMNIPTTREKPKPRPKQEEPSNLLGIVGVGCLMVAMILLIKFSVDSGWLTPFRQLVIAALFGGTLIALPFYIKSGDAGYIAQLPAAGIVVLHLTVYGSIFYHQLIDPMVGIWLVWAVGILSLWLLNKFKEDIFAILAIAGTYAGSYILRDYFSDFSAIAFHLIVWDIIFATFGIKLKNRTIICVAAYFSLGIGVLFALSGGSLSSERAQQLAIIQFFQIMVFAIATAIYSVRNKTILSETEAWQLIPVFLFFYGQEFYLLDLINPNFATIFSLAFATAILVIYWMARTRLGKEHLESSSAVLTLISIMFFHSIYFVKLGDVGKLFFGLGLMILLGLLNKIVTSRAMKGTLALSILLIGYSAFIIFKNPEGMPGNYILGFGFAYGVAMLIGYKFTPTQFLITAANVMIVLSIVRLKDLIGETWIGPLCVAYAFGCLIMALSKTDKALASAALPVIFFAIGRFVFFNFSNLSPLERIISLVAMGGMIYAGGFIYRRIPNKV